MKTKWIIGALSILCLLLTSCEYNALSRGDNDKELITCKEWCVDNNMTFNPQQTMFSTYTIRCACYREMVYSRNVEENGWN